MMKAMTIEAAVRWAVRDELPKCGLDVRRLVDHGAPSAAASSALAAMTAGALGAVSAPVNVYGVVIDLAAADRGQPHPDAVVIGEAMLALDVVEPAGFEQWDAFEDLGVAPDAMTAQLIERALADARARAGFAARMTGALSALMVKRAVLGPPTGWRIEPRPAARVMRQPNGKAAWFRLTRRAVAWDGAGNVTRYEAVETDDGWNARAQRPHQGAYQKHELYPDPLPAVTARAEWQLWRAALDVLSEDVAGRLTAISLLPCALPWRPWLEGEAPAPRVLPALDARANEAGRSCHMRVKPMKTQAKRRA